MTKTSVAIFIICTIMILSTSTQAGEVGVLFAGGSKHHTTTHAPKSGYNENHKVLGLEYTTAASGCGIGGSIARFNDSFNKASMWAMVTGECVKPFKYVSVGLGVGVGHLQTSHYKGGFGALYGKIKNPQTGLYIKIMPQPFSNNRIDSFTAVTLGISKEF